MIEAQLMLPNRLPWRAPLGSSVNPRDNQLKVELDHPAHKSARRIYANDN